jgi:two-component system NtrC family response regulator
MANVLLVDDDPAFGKSAAARLEADGHHVTFNAGGFGVARVIRDSSYDMILIDVLMPYIEGPKLMEYIPRKRLGGAQVLLVSSIAEGELCSLATTCGADGYFWKRAGLDHLCHLVRQSTAPPGRREEPRGGHAE